MKIEGAAAPLLSADPPVTCATRTHPRSLATQHTHSTGHGYKTSPLSAAAPHDSSLPLHCPVVCFLDSARPRRRHPLSPLFPVRDPEPAHRICISSVGGSKGGMFASTATGRPHLPLPSLGQSAITPRPSPSTAIMTRVGRSLSSSVRTFAKVVCARQCLRCVLLQRRGMVHPASVLSVSICAAPRADRSRGTADCMRVDSDHAPYLRAGHDADGCFMTLFVGSTGWKGV